MPRYLSTLSLTVVSPAESPHAAQHPACLVQWCMSGAWLGASSWCMCVPNQSTRLSPCPAGLVESRPCPELGSAPLAHSVWCLFPSVAWALISFPSTPLFRSRHGQPQTLDCSRHLRSLDSNRHFAIINLNLIHRPRTAYLGRAS